MLKLQFCQFISPHDYLLNQIGKSCNVGPKHDLEAQLMQAYSRFDLIDPIYTIFSRCLWQCFIMFYYLIQVFQDSRHVICNIYFTIAFQSLYRLKVQFSQVQLLNSVVLLSWGITHLSLVQLQGVFMFLSCFAWCYLTQSEDVST